MFDLLAGVLSMPFAEEMDKLFIATIPINRERASFTLPFHGSQIDFRGNVGIS